MARRSTTGLGYRPLGWALALTALALWSCGTPEERYESLSFFFDGVPVPESMRPVVEGEGDNTVSLVVVTHAPYAAQQCSECHGEVGAFSMSLEGYSGVSPKVCLKCHEEKPSEYHFMHGPVATLECLTCHDAHESRYEHLLLARAPKMCLQCHVEEDLHTSGTPEHEDLTADCLGCHNGHGGNDPSFLRVNLSPPASPDEAPQPEPSPAQTPPSESNPADQAIQEAGNEAGP